MELKSTEVGGRTMYEPALLKVAGHSEYNEQRAREGKPPQIRFEGVDKFWTLGERGQRAIAEAFNLPVDRPVPVPPVGTIAWFKLSSKIANPATGAMYRDIDGYVPATDQDKTAYSAPTRAETPEDLREAWTPPAATTSGTSVEERILLGMAFNNLTVMLASADENFSVAWYPTWEHWFEQAAAGQPLTPVHNVLQRGAVADAAEIEQQAQQHLADNPAWPAPEQPQQSVDTEQLPW